MSGHNPRGPRSLGPEITGESILTKETRLEKRWQMIPNRAADVLADLVFVMLILLLFVWVGLWTFVR